MPRGSKPGERRGGRQKGTPNKKTALIKAAFAGTASNPEMSPLDFFLTVMREPSVSAEWRFRAAQAAAPFVHPKAQRAQAVEPAAAAKQIESPSKDLTEDPLYQAIQAFERANDEECQRVARLRMEMRQKTQTS